MQHTAKVKRVYTKFSKSTCNHLEELGVRGQCCGVPE